MRKIEEGIKMPIGWYQKTNLGGKKLSAENI